MNKPTACTLSAADYATRRDDITRIARTPLRSREPLDGGARLTFAASDATERDLQAVIAAENECCSFLHFALERDAGMLRLDVTGPHDAQPIVAELFA